MVSPSNYFNFTPLLASCAVGTLEFRSAVEPVSVSAYQDSRVWNESLITHLRVDLGQTLYTGSGEPETFSVQINDILLKLLPECISSMVRLNRYKVHSWR